MKHPLQRMPPNTQQAPPSEEDLRNLYEEVRRGFASEGLRSLDDVRISVGTDDLGAFIDHYRDDASQGDLPGYEPSRRSAVVAAQSGIEKCSLFRRFQ